MKTQQGGKTPTLDYLIQWLENLMYKHNLHAVPRLYLGVSLQLQKKHLKN